MFGCVQYIVVALALTLTAVAGLRVLIRLVHMRGPPARKRFGYSVLKRMLPGNHGLKYTKPMRGVEGVGGCGHGRRVRILH